jgi:DNA-binding beta-propeller fold protein YncE
MNIAIVLLAGCASPGLKDPAYPTGSSTIVAQGRSLYAVNGWDGTLTRTDWQDGISRELELGGEPTRIAQVGDELWVTLRAERSVVILKTTTTLPEEVERFRVGAEPYGIVASEDGSRVFVAVSQEDAVLEIDAASREVLRRFEVGDDPRWLALHPNETALFVVYGFVHPITRIDLESGEQTEIDLPDTYVPPPDDSSGTASGSSGSGSGDDPIDLIPRNTGDPAISPRGDLLVVPTLYVDPSTPGDQPIVDGGNIQPPPVPYYVGASSGFGLQLSLSKFNPALVGVPLDPASGEVVPNDDVLAIFVGGFTPRSVVRGYVGSATFDPNGVQVYATIEAADAVAVVDLRPADGQGMNAASPNLLDSGSLIAPSEGNFWERPQVFVSVEGNPSGVAIDGDGFRWVHERGNRRVSWFRTSKVMSLLDEVAEGTISLERLAPAGRFEAGTVRIDPDVEAGRQLFYTANDARMSAVGAGVSCATCHFEGRNDGLTWAFDSDPRQTPTLVGPVGLTAPVTWTDGVPTVADEAMITSVGRMGGLGVGSYEAAQIEAFIESNRDVDVRDKGRSDPIVARGAELFASPEVGCVECHNGPRFTDNQNHRIFGMRVNTPGLVGIEATAPYFHDGSAATLKDVLLRVRDGSMGSTAGLSDADLEALETYLRSL